MPAVNHYTVDITIRVRDGRYEGPAEALQAAIAKLGITDQGLIVSTNVSRRIGDSTRDQRVTA